MSAKRRITPDPPVALLRVNYLLLTLGSVYLIIGLSAPFFSYFSLPYVDEVYKLGRSLCVQRPTRCLWFLNDHTALCAKCLGLYAGMTLGSMLLLWRRSWAARLNPNLFRISLATFLFMAGHSLLRARWGLWLPSPSISMLIGWLGGMSLVVLCSYLTLKGVKKTMLFNSKTAWVVGLLLILLLHLVGFSSALAAETAPPPATAQDDADKNKEVKSLKAEVERLQKEAERLKKEKQTEQLKKQAERLKREIRSLKETEKAQEEMKRPLPPSAQSRPLMAPVNKVLVPAGTPVILQVDTGFSSQEVREGDNVAITVQQPVRVNQITVIRQGVAARAVVASCKPAKSWGGAGELTLDVRSVPAVDGSQIRLRGRSRRQGESSHGEATAVAVGTGLICLPLALTGAAVTGEEGKFPTGHEIVAHTDGDQAVKLFSEADQVKIADEQREEAERLNQKFKQTIEENRKKREAEMRAAEPE